MLNLELVKPSGRGKYTDLCYFHIWSICVVVVEFVAFLKWLDLLEFAIMGSA